MKISICIPTYNRGKYIEALLENLINLPLERYEIMVIDNKSTDNTLSLLKNGKYKNVKVICNDENIGMVNNWNRCLELSSGEYIMILHSDDIVSPDLFKIYERIISRYPKIALIFSYPNVIDENGRFIGSKKKLKGNLHFKNRSLFKLLISYNLIYASGVMVKKENYQKLGDFENKFTFLPDYEMWLRIAFHSEAIYIDKPLFSYREHKENLFLTVSEKQYLREKLRILRSLQSKTAQAISVDKRIKDLIEFYYRFLIIQYIKRFHSGKILGKNLKTVVKFNLNTSISIFLTFIKTISHKPSYFENEKAMKIYYHPIWQFYIYFECLKVYFRPSKFTFIKFLYRILTKIKNKFSIFKN